MNVLVVEPGVVPYEKKLNNLAEMQYLVGGYIRAIYPFQEDVAVICNLKARVMRLPFNRSIPGEYGGVFGTFFVCGHGDKEFCSLARAQIKRYRAQFYEAELLLRMDRGKPITVLLPPRPRTRPAKREKDGGHESR